MKIICWLFFVSVNFLFLFVFTKGLDRPLLFKIFISLIPGLVIFAVIIMVLLKISGYEPDQNFEQIFFSIFFSLMIIIVINLFNQFFFFMIDSVVTFHKKNNVGNLDRNPIKFLINKQDILKKATTVIWFLGSALMLYGAWLGKK